MKNPYKTNRPFAKKMATYAALAFSAALIAGGVGWWGRGALAPMAEGSDDMGRNGNKAEASLVKYNCPMHPWIIKDEPDNCPICGMSLVPMKDHGHGAPTGMGESAIRIDPVVVQNMGVRTESVKRRDLSKEIRLSGKLSVDETRQVSVNAKIMGWVEKLHADYLGKLIRKGDILMEIHSPDLVITQEEYLQALRYRQAVSTGASEEAKRSAEELVHSARRRLEFWDIPVSAIERLAKAGVVGRTLPIVSPASGVVVAKNVVEGQNIMAGMELLRIADLSTIWAQGEIYQEDLPFVKAGQVAEVRAAYLPGEAIAGKVAFVSPVLDPGSKTAQVRVELKNTPDLLLKPGMVADIRLVFPLGESVAVPEQAVIRTGRRAVAVVALGDGYFEPRQVELGASAGGYIQVLQGLKEGDTLVVSSQFLIDSESNLKAAVMSMSRTEKSDAHSGHPGM